MLLTNVTSLALAPAQLMMCAAPSVDALLLATVLLIKVQRRLTG